MLRQVWRSDDGSALVEGAVLLPVLLVLLFGIFEFSWFFYQQHLISTGLRDGARYLARSATICDANSPFWSAQSANAMNLAATGSIRGGPPRVKGWSAAMVMLHCTEFDNAPAAGGPSPYRGNAVVSVVSLSTRFAEPSLGFFGLLGLHPPAISVTHSERMVGPG